MVFFSIKCVFTSCSDWITQFSMKVINFCRLFWILNFFHIWTIFHCDLFFKQLHNSVHFLAVSVSILIYHVIFCFTQFYSILNSLTCFVLSYLGHPCIVPYITVKSHHDHVIYHMSNPELRYYIIHHMHVAAESMWPCVVVHWSFD